MTFVADGLHGDCVISGLLCCPKQAAQLNELHQLLQRLAGVGIADARKRWLGVRKGNVLIRASDHVQLECLQSFVTSLFGHLSRETPVDTQDVLRSVLGNAQYSKRFEALKAPKARSCGRNADKQIIKQLRIGSAATATDAAQNFVDFEPMEIDMLDDDQAQDELGELDTQDELDALDALDALDDERTGARVLRVPVT